MNQPNARTLTLFDLLARRWQADAAIAAVRFASRGEVAAFATATGAVLLAAEPDAEPPESRVRISGDLGQITLRPREQEPAALRVVPDLADGAVPLAAAGDRILVGAGDGRVLALAPDGSQETLRRLDGAIAALDHASGITAAADATVVTLAGPDGTRALSLPGVRALALTRDGRLAAADAERITVDGHTLPIAGAVRLAWRDDGAWLAAALGAHGVALAPADGSDPLRLGDFPAPVGDLAWSVPGQAFVAAGAFRIAAWDAGAFPATDRPLVTGHPGLVVVEAVAAHPTKPLIAAGYANGQVVIAQVGRRDELLLRQDGGAVTALAFSPDGRHLAIGDAAGGAAIASFPPQMFK